MTRKRTEDLISELSQITGVEPSELVVEKPLDPSPVIDEFSLDMAADLLLKRLDPSIRDYAMEVADLVIKVPRWQLILGSMMAQYQSGALVAPYIDPSWQIQQVTESAGKCERCGKDFTPKKLRQRYCTNECGSLALKEIKPSESRINP